MSTNDNIDETKKLASGERDGALRDENGAPANRMEEIRYADRAEALVIAKRIFATNAELLRKLAQ